MDLLNSQTLKVERNEVGPPRARPSAWRGIFLPSLPIYPNLAQRNRVISCLFLCTELQLAFHPMDFLYGLREVGGKNDSFGMPALVAVCW